MKRRILLGVTALVIVAAIGAAALAVPRLPARTSTVPTTHVTKGPLKLVVHATGDLRAGRTVTLVAPPVGVYAIVYLGSLAVLLLAGFWAVDAFTS